MGLTGNPVVHLTEYELRHLAEHLEASGRAEDLHRLLALETGEQRNAWYEAKEAVGDTAGFLADVTRAWRLAERAYSATDSTRTGRSIGLQNRYALIRASLNSLAVNVPPALMSSLVQHGVWSPAQGVTYARQVPDSMKRVTTLISLLPLLTETQRLEVVRETLRIAVRIALANAWGFYFAKVLTALASYLPEDLLREALTIVQKLEHPCHFRALVGLIPRLAELGYLGEALTAAKQIRDRHWRSQVLVDLAPYLAKAKQERILWEIVTTAPTEPEVLEKVVPLLPKHLKEKAVRNALAAARTLVMSKHDREYLKKECMERVARLLVSLAPYLPESLLREAVATARAIELKPARAEALGGLASHLPEPLRGRLQEEALAVARSVRHQYYRGVALRNLAPYLPEELLQKALLMAQKIDVTGQPSAFALPRLAGRLAELGHYENALRVARSIGDEWQRSEALGNLAPYMPEPLLREVLLSVCEIKKTMHRAEVLEDLAGYLSSPLLQEVLALVWRIGDRDTQLWALAELAPHLPEPLLQETLARESLTMVERMPRECRLAVEPKQLRLLAVCETGDSTLLEVEIPYLSEPLKQENALEILEMALSIEYGGARVDALVALVPRLGELGYHEEALRAARAIDSPNGGQAHALINLTSYYVSVGLLQKALKVALELPNYESTDFPSFYWKGAERPRTRTLAELAHFLLELPTATLYLLWPETVHRAADRTREDLLSDISALGPAIARLGGVEAVAETFRAIQDVGRWWP